ncbi:MAG TPA: right-handed parallel beta-helix repeat-containing protein [Gaiellaceae bacterium]|jgi:nitrous oxidase accessory protein NosD|nr:right-handed parallel beta-helix repeat-containing protein [Gaiellaceae bacterium]
MSYTLRGRIDSRLAAALGPALAAAALALVLHRWWPVEVAGLMVGVGVALDLLLYDRVLDYQPGWAALPLGALELGAVMALAYALDVRAPLAEAVGFFCGAWLLAQALGHAVYPLLRLSYGDDGGELGRPGASMAAVLAALFLAAGGVAFATRPPTVTLAAGVHRGPIVVDREEVLTGEPGAVVRGGIVVRADGVTVRDLTVVGGENGISVIGARRVTLERVRVIGSKLDGIHARFAGVMVRDCTVSLSGRYGQGIDISYAAGRGMSSVEGCDVSGGQEGIVTHADMVDLRDNHVDGTSLRGIAMTEMSMGEITGNDVSGALGVGIFCGDHSMCEIADNIVANTRPDDGSGDRTRPGVGIEAHSYAEATLGRNTLVGNPVASAAFLGGRLLRDR